MTAVIDELEGLLREATARPWKVGEEPEGRACVVQEPGGYGRAITGWGCVTQTPENARLIVAAVNALPALLAVARAADAVIAAQGTWHDRTRMVDLEKTLAALRASTDGGGR